MVLRVHGEHTPGADHHVVDIRATLPDAHGMQDSPLHPEPSELLGNSLLAVRADPPRPLVGLRIDQPGDQVSHQPLSGALGTCPLPGRGTRADVGQVMPSVRGGHLGPYRYRRRGGRRRGDQGRR